MVVITMMMVALLSSPLSSSLLAQLVYLVRCTVALLSAHGGDGVGSGRAVKEFCRGMLLMKIEGC